MNVARGGEAKVKRAEGLEDRKVRGMKSKRLDEL